MINVSSSIEFTDSIVLKETSKNFYKREYQSPIKLPKIKIEYESNLSTPVLKPETRKQRTLEKTMQKPQDRQAIKLNDVTETLSKDLPKTLFKSIVISPKRTSKIFAAIECTNPNDQNKSIKNPNSFKDRKEILKKKKNAMLDKILQEIEITSEFSKERKKNHGSSIVRPISPWLYQGNSRRYSIFSKNN
jgi:hypothetical protein